MSSLCVCNECSFYILWKRSSPKCYSPFVLSGLLMLLYQCPYYFHSVPRAPKSSRSWNAIHPFNKEKSLVLPFSIRKYVFNYLCWDIADWSRWMKAEMRNYCSYFEMNSKNEVKSKDCVSSGIWDDRLLIKLSFISPICLHTMRLAA